MKRVLVVITVGAIGAAYLAGYWPQRQGRVASQEALAAMGASLERSQARNRLYGLQSQLVALRATVEARNFGDAQGEAGAFFDSVRAEAGRRDQSHARQALEGIAAGRDSLTVALTQSDPAALEMVQGAMTRLGDALEAAPGVETGMGSAPTAPSPERPERDVASDSTSPGPR
jgi:hypothetical protein